MKFVRFTEYNYEKDTFWHYFLETSFFDKEIWAIHELLKKMNNTDYSLSDHIWTEDHINNRPVVNGHSLSVNIVTFVKPLSGKYSMNPKDPFWRGACFVTGSFDELRKIIEDVKK